MPGPSTRALVPFPRLSAVIGYMVLCLAAIALLLEGGSYLALHLYHSSALVPLRTPEEKALFAHCRGVPDGKCFTSSDAWDDLRSASPAYDGDPDAERMWGDWRKNAELPLTPDSFTAWRARDFQGTVVHADHGRYGLVRRTLPPPAAACDPAKTHHLWIFGGSVAFGFGATDSETFASQLAQRAQAEGECWEVVNLGTEGFVVQQDLALLVQELRAGHRPDAVIFVDGMNDAIANAVFDQPIPRPQSEAVAASWMPRWLRDSNTMHIVRGLAARRSAPAPGSSEILARTTAGTMVRLSDAELDSRARRTLDAYFGSVTVADALAKSYGFRAYFFWQPSLVYGSKPTVPFEKALQDSPHLLEPYEFTPEAGKEYHRILRAVYAEADRRSQQDARLRLLVHLFDGTSTPVYADDHHVGPLGNKMIAEELWRVLHEQDAVASQRVHERVHGRGLDQDHK